MEETDRQETGMETCSLYHQYHAMRLWSCRLWATGLMVLLVGGASWWMHQHYSLLSRLLTPRTSRYYEESDTPRMDNITATQATLVVHLSGQLGNHMHCIARGYGLQQWMQEQSVFDTNAQVVYWMQVLNDEEYEEAQRTQLHLQRAFPNTFHEETLYFITSRNIDGSSTVQGERSDNCSRSSPLYRQWTNFQSDLAKSQQILKHYLDKDYSKWQQNLQNPDPSDWQRALHDIAIAVNSTNAKNPILLEIQSMESHWLVNRYLDRIRTELFPLDYTQICGVELPGPKEWVLHYRNFRLDVPKYYHELGFEELTPARLVSEIFADLPTGSQVAIVGYHLDTQPGSNQNETIQFLLQKSMEDQGLVPRFVHHYGDKDNDSTLQDFCFLSQTQSTLVGTWRSTFLHWAAILSRTVEHVDLYVLDSPYVRNRFGENLTKMASSRNHWTHPDLQGRFSSPIIPGVVEQQDQDSKQGP